MSIDFRACLYALSDVIINRPPPLRVFDQIYMKLPDMLLQAELIGRWFMDKDVVFIGDGDAIALSLVHLGNQRLLPSMPSHVAVLDFDERVVNSVNHFAAHFGLDRLVGAELYNVADPIPEQHWERHDAFYTNPPWGASNDGTSVTAFMERGIESVKGAALACVVLGDHPDFAWTREVQLTAQRLLLSHEFRIAEMLPRFHHYHLDDSPELTSCSLIAERKGASLGRYASEPLDDERRRNFYGSDNPLRIRYVRDLRNGGKFETRDIETTPIMEHSDGIPIVARPFSSDEGRKPCG